MEVIISAPKRKALGHYAETQKLGILLHLRHIHNSEV
jgi:hypothetical protein